MNELVRMLVSCFAVSLGVLAITACAVLARR